jgi:MarR family transcriptional regulator, organic hydroperoxide resistance regulator
MTGDAGDQLNAYRLEDSLGFLVNQASRSIRRRFDRELACRDVTVTGEQYGVMVHLWHRGAQHQKDLAGILAKDKTTIARLVGALEARGMVHRAPDPGDRRHNLLSLTDLGEESMTGLTAAAQAVLSEVVRQLPPEEVATCKQVLRGICSALDPQWSSEEGGVT